MRSAAPVWLALLTFVPLHGQTAVEAAFGASHAATTAAPAQGLGKALGAVLNGLDKTLKSGQPASESPGAAAAAVIVSPDKMATPKADVRTYWDPKPIQPGLAYDDLLQQAGPPVLELTTAPGRKSLMYLAEDGAITRIDMLDGKVLASEASKAKQAAPQPSGIIVLK